MTNAYRNFRELSTYEIEGLDWSLEYLDRGSPILVMAPHGGWIEPFTSEIARAVAGDDLSFYTFRGLSARRSRKGRRSLHITSHLFDEPVASRAAARVHAVLAVHGERSRDGRFVMVGGRWRWLGNAIARRLEKAGFPVRAPRPGLEGLDRLNICNRGTRGGGVQLEISEGLRSLLRQEEESRTPFVAAVRTALGEWAGQVARNAGTDEGWTGRTGVEP